MGASWFGHLQTKHCLLQDDWGVEIVKTIRQKEARRAHAEKAWLNLEKTVKEAAASSQPGRPQPDAAKRGHEKTV